MVWAEVKLSQGMVSPYRLWEMFLNGSGQAEGDTAPETEVAGTMWPWHCPEDTRKCRLLKATKQICHALGWDRGTFSTSKKVNSNNHVWMVSLTKRWAFRLFVTTPISHSIHPFFSKVTQVKTSVCSMDGTSCSVNVTEQETDPWVRKIRFLVSQIETSNRECHSGDWLLCFCKQELSFTKFQVSLVKKGRCWLYTILLWILYEIG